MELFASPPLAMSLPSAILVSALAYVLGSFPTGAIIARVYGKFDLTRVGSSRTGATNALRTMGIGAGVIVLVGDFAKGALAVLLAKGLVGDPLGVGLAAFFAVVGHNRSVFLGFRGGRGVVTGLGGLAVIAPWIFVVVAVAGSIVCGITRYVSLGSICGAVIAIPLALGATVAGTMPAVLTVYVVITASLIIAAHADNISRLLSGTERRLGESIDRRSAP
ncbi:MAG TPA: glycerol-3-phosphate 1-O-acyltransferase PlsY [Chloroflexota bacterium]|nr:glycerol-3-phosphate 1-O-acyltransferase PlsY [Chloroflexota bacterium]